MEVGSWNGAHFVFNVQLVILRHYLLNLLVIPLHGWTVLLLDARFALLNFADLDVRRINVTVWRVVDILRLANALLLNGFF